MNHDTNVVRNAQRYEKLRLWPPPRCYYGWRLREMPASECSQIVADYNAFARSWNRAELNRFDPPEWPAWELADALQCRAQAKSALVFEMRETGLLGVIKIREWRPWLGNRKSGPRAFCRRMVNMDDVLWAAWRRPSKAERKA